jgi:hypothetical protein
MRRLPVLLAMLVMACSQAAQPTAKHMATPSAMASPSPVAEQSPSPSASPSVFDLPLTTVGFSCRLPISTPDGQGAFISFPTAATSFDSQAHGLAGHGGAYYDRAFSRWLPVLRQAVSPDGKHYAYGEAAPDQTKVATMHVVDVATGIDHVFSAPTGAWYVAYGVLDYSSDGIYLMTNYEVSHGIAVMDPQTGLIRPVADLLYIQASGGHGVFWVGTPNPADPHPLGGIGAVPNQVDRFNLYDSSRTPWFYRPTNDVYALGIDWAGHPIVRAVNGRFDQAQNFVVVGDSGAELLLLIDPQTRLSLFKGDATFIDSLGDPITDSHGIWFGSRQGIYLSTDLGGLQKVSDQPGYPANGCF